MNAPTPHTQRPPVIAVMGHVDHGKSALLDYIRSTNVVESETGGITQRVSAYEVAHNHDNVTKRITFLDTPGHEAFAKIRARGASVADIAILVVSAEEGVKPQTLDALTAIKATGIPYVVAINKIDKPNANPDHTKSSLIENEIYIEGMGGDVPYTEISAKTGAGIDELLDTLLLVAEMEELSADPTAPAEGVVIEAHRDSKKGVAATLLIKNGTLTRGQFVVADHTLAPVRVFEDVAGSPIDTASFSSPVRIIGFNDLPRVGSTFRAFDAKKEAERVKSAPATHIHHTTSLAEDDERALIPLVIKADATGTLEAIAHELKKLESERVLLCTIQEGIGNVSEGDVHAAIASQHDAPIIAFNVEIDSSARDIALQHKKEIHTFDIIYKLSEWLDELVATRTPKCEVSEDIGTAKVLMHFSSTKDKHVVGGKVKSGEIKADCRARIQRAGDTIAEGRILNLQSGKQDVERIEEGAEFGAQIQCGEQLQPGDTVTCYDIIVR